MTTRERDKKVSHQLAVVVVCLAVLVPACLSRLSPPKWSTLLLVSPAFLVVGLISFAAFDLWATWYLLRSDSDPHTTRWSVRPLSFTTSAKWAAINTKAAWESNPQPHPPFLQSSKALSKSLAELLTLVIRDFVLKWLSTFSDSPAFPHAVEKTVRSCASTVGQRASKVDWSEVMVAKIVPIITNHLERFRTAELALKGHDLKGRLTESVELDLFVAERYALEAEGGKLHPAVYVSSPSSRPIEEAWLRDLIAKILPLVMPEQEVRSDAVRLLTREIVTCSVLLPVLDMMSDPDFWNKLIDEKAGAVIRDQKMVEQFREALDKQGDAISAAATPAGKTRPRRRSSHEDISPATSTKRFDAFLGDIERCSSLAEARRIANDVSSQIRKTKELLVSTNTNSVSEYSPEILARHVERLEVALKKADRRVRHFGGTTSNAVASEESEAQPVPLKSILLHPPCLSYFMEYQERRSRSLLVRYWLLVEGLKDPLEDFSLDVAESQLARPAPTTEEITTAKEDCRLIWDSYFATNPLGINEKYRKVVSSFLQRDEAEPVTAHDIWQLKRAIFASQRDVLAEMEDEDFPSFRKTDLYFMAVSDLRVAGQLESGPGRKRKMSFTRSKSANDTSTPGSGPTISRLLFRSRFLPLQSATRPEVSVRTETAPPKVSLEAAAFDRPAARRAMSDNASADPPARDPSITSQDSAPQKPRGMADSLDFLIHSPTLHEDDQVRSPLFEDEDGDDPLVQSVASIRDDDQVQAQTIAAIQDALNSILTANDRAASAGPSSLSASQELAPRPDKRAVSSSSAPVASTASRSGLALSEQAKASSSTRVPSGSSAKSMPEQQTSKKSKGIFDDVEDVSSDEEGGAAVEEVPAQTKDVQLAMPGDLHLADEIHRLSLAIDRLRNQQAVVGALIRKAELTGNLSELKLLTKSRQSLDREEQTLSFQKSQYETQESENKLTPERTRISITGTSIGQAGGEKFHLYLVEVVQTGTDGAFTSGWIVTRRYSDFANLHAALKEKYPVVRSLELPGKKLVTPYSDSFIEQRRQGLEAYLRSPAVCQSVELRAFMSQQNISLPRPDNSLRASLLAGPNIVKSVYKSLASGIDDIFTGNPISLMDTIVDRLSQQAAGLAGYGTGKLHDEDLVGQVLSEQSATTAALDIAGAPDPLSYFTAPLCDLFVALFELKEKNNWLRRQAIVIVLQQILGGAIERKIRDSVALLLQPDSLAGYLSILQGSMWPNGELKPKEPPRTAEQKRRTRDSAQHKLVEVVPAIAGSFIGRGNAKRGARRMFAVLQNRRLNQHLMYSILDVILPLVFPELLEGKKNRPVA